MIVSLLLWIVLFFYSGCGSVTPQPIRLDRLVANIGKQNATLSSFWQERLKTPQLVPLRKALGINSSQIGHELPYAQLLMIRCWLAIIIRLKRVSKKINRPSWSPWFFHLFPHFMHFILPTNSRKTEIRKKSLAFSKGWCQVTVSRCVTVSRSLPWTKGKQSRRSSATAALDEQWPFPTARRAGQPGSPRLRLRKFHMVSPEFLLT